MRVSAASLNREGPCRDTWPAGPLLSACREYVMGQQGCVQPATTISLSNPASRDARLYSLHAYRNCRVKLETRAVLLMCSPTPAAVAQRPQLQPLTAVRP